MHIDRDVVWGADNKSIVSIGGQDLKNIPVDALRKFANQNKVILPNDRRRNDQICECIANFKFVGAPLRSAMKPKKQAASTRPYELGEEDNSIFRVILVLFLDECRKDYISTGSSYDRKELDSNKGHQALFSNMHEVYLDDSIDALDTLGDMCAYYTVAGVSQDAPSDFVELSLDAFIATIKFINFHYSEALSKNQQSGTHDDFDKFTAGKPWLYFYHKMLTSIGNTELNQMAYPTLPAYALLTSCDSVLSTNKRKTPLSTAPPRKRGPASAKASHFAKKAEATDAMKTKAESIGAVADHNLQTLRVDRYTALLDQIHSVDADISELTTSMELYNNQEKSSMRKKLKHKKKLLEWNLSGLQKEMGVSFEDSDDDYDEEAIEHDDIDDAGEYNSNDYFNDSLAN